jgi:hypothetical protein
MHVVHRTCAGMSLRCQLWLCLYRCCNLVSMSQRFLVRACRNAGASGVAVPMNLPLQSSLLCPFQHASMCMLAAAVRLTACSLALVTLLLAVLNETDEGCWPVLSCQYHWAAPSSCIWLLCFVLSPVRWLQ